MGALLSILANWKTTGAGLVAIITVLVQLFSTLTSTGTLELGSSLWADITGLAAGVGLMFAKDSNKTNSPTPVATKSIK